MNKYYTISGFVFYHANTEAAMKRSSIALISALLFSLILSSCGKQTPTPATEAQKMIEMKDEAEKKLNDAVKTVEEKGKKALEDM